MRDIVLRVPTLSFIDVSDVLVFARSGRSNADGPFATCHCLTQPPSDDGYYFWRDRASGHITRRSEWFVTKSPTVSVGGRPMKYMISFALPRFCDQSLDRTRKERFYPGADAWMAKLDTVVHELYHIDPQQSGIRRIEREDGSYLANCHGHQFFEQVAEMVTTYMESAPDPAVYDFLRARLRRAHPPLRRRRGDDVPHVPVVSAAIHRARRHAARLRIRRRRRRDRAGAPHAAADLLHRAGSADASVPEEDVAQPGGQGRIPARPVRSRSCSERLEIAVQRQLRIRRAPTKRCDQ